MSDKPNPFKVKEAERTTAWSAYRQLYFGDVSLPNAIRTEMITFLFSTTPGAIGLGFRKLLYPCLFAQTGSRCIFGRNLTLRHTHKIRLGTNVILDDGVVLDAKGHTNQGITIGNNVYVGRNTIIYTKNGNIRIGDNVNISSNCQIFSSGDVVIGEGTMIAGFCYILNGGVYNMDQQASPFARQDGTSSEGPTVIGPNCWLAAHTTITDGIELGRHCVVGAGSVVLADMPQDSLCAGTPAKKIRDL